MDIGHDNGGESFEKMRAQAGRAFFQKFDVLADAGGGNRANNERQSENKVDGKDEKQTDANIDNASVTDAEGEGRGQGGKREGKGEQFLEKEGQLDILY